MGEVLTSKVVVFEPFTFREVFVLRQNNRYMDRCSHFALLALEISLDTLLMLLVGQTDNKASHASPDWFPLRH